MPGPNAQVLHDARLTGTEPRTMPFDGPRARLGTLTWVALAVTLVAYPALYCSGVMGALVRPILTEHSRPHWWAFWLANMGFHWLPFLLVWFTLRRTGEGWSSLGVDWSWFRRHRRGMACVLALLVGAAFVVPGLYYGDSLPGISRTVFLAPVSTAERLWVIWGAITAGVTEEVLFRGFALTRLARVLGSAWRALPVTVVAFLFIHGTPRDVGGLVAYTLAGLAFGVPFILLRLRRLELLIALHVGIDAGMVFAP